MSPYLNTRTSSKGLDAQPSQSDVYDIARNNDQILLDLRYPSSDLKRGMVVAFRTPHDPEKWAIKRVVALQGDRVTPLPHYPSYAELQGKGLVVPYGHIWVEGDVEDGSKEKVSLDSNSFGPIAVGLVMGKAKYVISMSPSFLSLPIFKPWTAVDIRHFKIPERVKINAASLPDPDTEYQRADFERMLDNGRAAGLLLFLEEQVQGRQARGDDNTFDNEGQYATQDAALFDFLKVIGRAAALQLDRMAAEHGADGRNARGDGDGETRSIMTDHQAHFEDRNHEKRKIARQLVELVQSVLGGDDSDLVSNTDGNGLAAVKDG